MEDMTPHSLHLIPESYFCASAYCLSRNSLACNRKNSRTPAMWQKLHSVCISDAQVPIQALLVCCRGQGFFWHLLDNHVFIGQRVYLEEMSSLEIKSAGLKAIKMPSGQTLTSCLEDKDIWT